MDEAIKVEVPSEPPLPYRNPHVGAQDPTQVPNLQMPFYHNNQSQRTFHPQGPFKEDDSPSMSSLPFHSQSTNLPFPQPAPSYSTAPPSSLLRELNLFPVHLDDWILLQRSTFDLFYHDEPFVALQLLIHPGSRKFIERVWGRTKIFGHWESAGDLEKLCRTIFQV